VPNYNGSPLASVPNPKFAQSGGEGHANFGFKGTLARKAG
jgi:hypothetical protein